MSCNLKITNLCAKMGERVLFENLNLELSHKQKVAIIGPNGCGKTTMLEILGGLREKNGGEIEIFHHKISIKVSIKVFLQPRSCQAFPLYLSKLEVAELFLSISANLKLYVYSSSAS